MKESNSLFRKDSTKVIEFLCTFARRFVTNKKQKPTKRSFFQWRNWRCPAGAQFKKFSIKQEKILHGN
jgi:hypothetical protein